MSGDGIELERVVRTGARGRATGKIHLTALVPDLGDVRTLCGQHFPAASARAVEEPADCQPCLRRRRNPSLVSAALFDAGLGAKLLELSLEQAGRKPERTAERPQVVRGADTKPAAPARAGHPAEPRTGDRARPGDPDAGAAPQGPPHAPRLRVERPGELDATGLEEIGEDLYQSPAGVLIRLRRRDDHWYVAELVHEGAVLIRRRSDSKLELRIGDVQIELDAEGTVRALYSLG